MKSQDNQIVLFQSQDGRVRLEVNRDEQTVWLRQEQIAELFDKDVSGISRHISKIFSEGELEKESNLQKMQFTGIDKPVNFYSLDVVLAVGYRASSRRATEFRIWAGQHPVSGRGGLSGFAKRTRAESKDPKEKVINIYALPT